MSKYFDVISRTPLTLHSHLKYSLQKQPKLSIVIDFIKIRNYTTVSTCTNLFVSNQIYSSPIRTIRGFPHDNLRARQRNPAENALASFEQVTFF